MGALRPRCFLITFYDVGIIVRIQNGLFHVLTGFLVNFFNVIAVMIFDQSVSNQFHFPDVRSHELTDFKKEIFGRIT